VFQLRMMGDTARPPGDTFEVDSAQHRRFAERRISYQRIVLDSVFGVRDADVLGRLPADTVFARWMRAVRPADDSRGPRRRDRGAAGGVLPPTTRWPTRSSCALFPGCPDRCPSRSATCAPERTPK
jgi:hypothetical protein